MITTKDQIIAYAEGREAWFVVGLLDCVEYETPELSQYAAGFRDGLLAHARAIRPPWVRTPILRKSIYE